MTTQQVLTDGFTGKEGYLAWRAEWRKLYAALSADIRTKRRNKEYHVGESRMAHKLMIRRKWSKEEAQRQYLESKANPPAVAA